MFPVDFPQSPREMESLAPSERVTRIEQKPGSPVNYEVLIMRQAQRQQTPSMAVRCYNVFSGALSVILARNTLVVKDILRKSKSSGTEHCGPLEATMLGGLPGYVHMFNMLSYQSVYQSQTESITLKEITAKQILPRSSGMISHSVPCIGCFTRLLRYGFLSTYEFTIYLAAFIYTSLANGDHCIVRGLPLSPSSFALSGSNADSLREPYGTIHL